MSDYRRVFVQGGTFFFTVVTFDRQPFLTTDLARQILRRVWKIVQQKHPFTCDAICLLPEHLHCLWTLPQNDMNYSIRWSAIKALFSKNYLREGGKEEKRNLSRQRKGEAAVWQRRYWEHCIRDEQDFKRHFDYIHYNPVKHNYVTNVCEWKWSSFHTYKAKGYYPEDWGENDIEPFFNNDEFGE